MELAMLLDGESISTVPEQKEYENIIVDCGDSATGEWDTTRWAAVVLNIKNPKVKCSINFIRKDYQEDILNGTDPILASSLIPVKISDDGTVTKANIKEEWYNYTDKIWANAVILEDENVTYKNGEVIPESNIESYFVWIPRYKYKIWDEGKYTGLTTIDESKVHTIQVEFETKEVTVSNGSTVNSWLTHPSFTTFDVNGMWVGKFEPGYKGEKTNEAISEKLQIKPNVYVWGGMIVANDFITCYDYKRELDSHMMKNTEWGAVAYLQHSAYGSQTSVRNNNNPGVTGYAAKNEPTIGYTGEIESGNIIEHITPGKNGENTFMYNTDTGYLASTTGNISGIYDMSGGIWEYVMGIRADNEGKPLSGTNKVINSGFTGKLGCPTCNNLDGSVTEIKGITWPESKYYDLYPYGTTSQTYGNRILGDATGEMGPFFQKIYSTTRIEIGSWYDDLARFVSEGYPWFRRGGDRDGTNTGVFAFTYTHGGAENTFRVVLAPQS